MIRDIPVTVGAGMNDSVHEALLTDGECPLLRNWLPRGREWSSRRALEAIHSLAATERLLSAWAWKYETQEAAVEPETGPSDSPQSVDYVLFAGGNGSILKASGSGFTPLPENGVDLEVSSGEDANRPWWAVVRGKQAYVCRQGQKDGIPDKGRVFHVREDFVSKAGIAAPTAAPNCTPISGGVNMAPGEYLCAYSFVLGNGNESDLSPTDAVTIAAGERINWAAILNSAHPRCNARRLYVTVPGGTTLFFALEVDNIPGTNLSITDVAVDDYGDEAVVGLTYPPLDPFMLTAWQDRLWVNDGEMAWPSDIEHWEEFDPLKAVRVRTSINDISRLRSLVPWDNTRMAFLKEHSVHALYVDPGSVFGYRTEHISTKVGCAGAGSAVIAEGTLFWYSGLHVWASTGSEPVCVSDKKIERMLSRVPASRREHAWMEYDERTGFVILSLTTGDGATENNTGVAFNVRTGQWTILRWNESEDGTTSYFAPTWIGRLLSETQDQTELCATFDNLNFVVRLNGEINTRDFAGPGLRNPIRCAFVSPCVQADGHAVGVRRVRILVSDQRERYLDPTHPSYLLPTYGDFALRQNNKTVTATREDVRLDNSSTEWTVINLNNLDDPGNVVSLQGVIFSNKPISIHGIVFESTIFAGRTAVAV